MKKIITFAFAALLGSAITLGGYWYLFKPGTKEVVREVQVFQPTKLAGLANNDFSKLNFNYAAEYSVTRVVHIKSKSVVQSRQQVPDPFRYFFDDRYQPQNDRPKEEIQRGSGSGVIISTDGYIVTNNHVIKGADELEVVLSNNKSYDAKVIGFDPSTDIALLKIDESGLDYLKFKNSDQVRLGDWVLAVGNPFSLSSTVTAGIVSAKGRSINILGNSGIESFIQTDAAVNPGNSGGALVDLEGNLIGINTAIATPTGVYAGYSFAVPSNIVQKVITDLREFGTVQRAFLGVTIREMNADYAQEKNVDLVEGVYIETVGEGSAAESAKLEVGDIIIKVDDTNIKNTPQLLETIGSHRPGDQVSVTYVRNGKQKTVDVILKNKEGNLEIVRKENGEVAQILGAQLEKADKKLLKENNLEGGVVVKKLLPGKLRSETNIREGFIITKMNNTLINTPKDLEDALADATGGVLLEGVYPGKPGIKYHAFGIE